MGLITLDIDGTITSEHESVPPTVIHYLRDLVNRGWHLLFVTGRSFPRTKKLLASFDFPFHLAVQNGAQIYRMPEGKRIDVHSFDQKFLPLLEKQLEDEPTGLLIYTDQIERDLVLYRKDTFSAAMHAYLMRRTATFEESVESVDSFFTLPPFSAVKILGDMETVERIHKKLLAAELALDMPLIRDPFQEGYSVIQVTRVGVNKGAVLDWFCKTYEPEGQLIVAGDDYNDLTMLRKADIAVVMANAPEAILRVADVIAPIASEQGIIQGLKEAIGK